MATLQQAVAKTFLTPHIGDPRSPTNRSRGYLTLERAGLLEPDGLASLSQLTVLSLRYAEGEPISVIIGWLADLLMDTPWIETAIDKTYVDRDSKDAETYYRCAAHLLESAWHAGMYTLFMGSGGYRIALSTEAKDAVPDVLKPTLDKSTSRFPFAEWEGEYCTDSDRHLITNRTLPRTDLLINVAQKPMWLNALHRLESTAFAINAEVLSIATRLQPNLKHSGSSDKARDSNKRRFESVLRQAQELDGDSFYRRIQADARGRFVDSAATVTHTGDDLQRALVQFAKPVKIERESDIEYLWLHLANTLGLKGSMQDRIDEAKAYRSEVLRWASDPVGTFSAWGQYEDKWQLIRTAIEFREIQRSGLTSLPISLDQNASAYQHLALLYRSKDLAINSNLTDKYVHMYAVIADKVNAPEIERADLIKIVKKVTMPRMYGGRDSTAEKAIAAMREDIAVLRTMYDDAMVSAEMDEYITTRKIKIKGTKDQTDVVEVGYEPFEYGRNYDYIDSNGEVYKDALKPRTDKSIFARAISLAYGGLVQQVLTALKAVVPEENVFRETVNAKALAEAKNSGHVQWVSASGFPVHIRKSKTSKYRIELRLGFQKVKLVFYRYRGELSERRTASATVPGVIHSLDAAVMHRVATEFNHDAPLISNHDSFSTLLPYASELQKAFSEALIWAHADDQLLDWTRQIHAELPESIGGLHTPETLVTTTTNALN